MRVVPTSPEPERDDAVLRAEHDALAARLAARRSIDEVRWGAYAGFAAFIVAGLAAKLAWDRWGPVRRKVAVAPPLLFGAAVAVAVALALFAARRFVRARRRMREEDADYARFQELRRRLGIDR